MFLFFELLLRLFVILDYLLGFDGIQHFDLSLMCNLDPFYLLLMYSLHGFYFLLMPLPISFINLFPNLIYVFIVDLLVNQLILLILNNITTLFFYLLPNLLVDLLIILFFINSFQTYALILLFFQLSIQLPDFFI